MNVYGQKDEKGEVIKERGDHGFKIIEGKEEECHKAMSEFGERTCEVEFRPINDDCLEGLRVSVNDLQRLGPAYKSDEPQDDANNQYPDIPGPGLPRMEAVGNPTEQNSTDVPAPGLQAV